MVLKIRRLRKSTIRIVKHQNKLLQWQNMLMEYQTVKSRMKLKQKYPTETTKECFVLNMNLEMIMEQIYQSEAISTYSDALFFPIPSQFRFFSRCIT